MSEPKAPESQDGLVALQRRLAEDFEPVTAFRPERASLWIVILGFTVGTGSLLWFFDLRPDAQVLGSGWLWGPAVVATALGAGLIHLALRSLIPGNRPPTSWLTAAAVGAVVVFCLISLGVHSRSPVETPSEHAFAIGWACFLMELCLAIPMLILLALAARRGLTAAPLKPALVGCLGVALIADAVWRLFCQYSDPAHVGAAHGLGMLTVILFGAIVVLLWDVRRSGRRSG